MPAPSNIALTPAQLAKQAERKAAKLAKKAATADKPLSSAEAERRRILARRWVPVQNAPQTAGKRSARIVTWNMLAQTLVRRELFPGSDCLRWSDRKAMLQAEMASHHDVDIVCLQECDRLGDVLGSVPNHRPVEAKGVGKLHGLVVLYNANRFFPRTQKTVALDEELLSPQAEGAAAQRGGSRQTRNIGLIVALEESERQGEGLIVVTTHLFWHPKFEYERVRQVIVLLRAIRQMQKDAGCEGWPVILSGDLNTEPDEALYQLLTAPTKPLQPHFVEFFNNSRLVHQSVVKIGVPPNSEPPSTSASGTATPVKEKDDEGEGDLPDTDERSIAGTVKPTSSDGILELVEMVSMFQDLLPEPARSAYGAVGTNEENFASRGGFPDGIVDAEGGNEPAYTCFTPLFKLTLDYVFMLPFGPRVDFTQLLEAPKSVELGNGLPRKGVSASDHLAVGCEIVW